MTPKRIQRKRTKGWKMPPDTIYVGRPTKWGNPFRVVYNGTNYNVVVGKTLVAFSLSKEMATGLAVNKFKEWALVWSSGIKHELKGKNLACWCKEGEACHADVLLEIANK